MTVAIFDQLGGSVAALSAFGKMARSADWAALAPLVFRYATAGDPVANAIAARGKAEIEALIDRLAAEGVGRVALMGGLAASYRTLLAIRFAPLVVDPLGDALDGALGLARRNAGS